MTIQNKINKALVSTGIVSKKLLTTTAMTAAGMLLISGQSKAADDWTDHVVTGGGGSISIDTAIPDTTNITQSGHRVTVSGDGDIKAGWTVNVLQDTSSSQYILFDVEGDPTFIQGNLNANGEVIIFDQNGVIFGRDSKVDVGSIVASTGSAAQADLTDGDGKMTISNFGDGEILNEGSITVSDAGIAAFVSPTISNSGVINAKVGTVAMAAGEKVTLDMYGDGLLEVAVEGELANGLIKNSGDINAAGGTVIMDAKVAKEVVEDVINVGGVVSASSATVKGGKIILSGGNKGTVKVSGKVEAKGKGLQDAGTINITGHNVELANNSLINADSETASAGDIIAIADNNLTVNGLLSAQGLNDTGFIETSAPTVLFGSGASILATREWLLDPTNINIDNALALLIEGQLSTGDATVETPLGGADLGRIDVNASIYWNTDNTLRFFAYDDINFHTNSGIHGDRAGSHFIAEAGDDIRLRGNTTGIFSRGGDITLTAGDEFTLTSGEILTPGGDIIINNGGSFGALANSIKNSGLGTISLNQNKPLEVGFVPNPTIQNAIDSVFHVGTGLTTINVGAGTWSESLIADISELHLKGANAGVEGDDARAPETIIESAGTAITVLDDNVMIDGFRIDGLWSPTSIGVHDLGNINTRVYNNYIFKADIGVFLEESTFGQVQDNLIHNVAENGVLMDGTNNSATNSNIITIITGDAIKSINTGDHNLINDNQIKDVSDNAISVSGGTRTFINNNFIGLDALDNNIGMHGVFVDDSTEATVFNNIIKNTKEVGVRANNITDSLIDNNNISDTGTHGIYVSSSNNTTISNNVLNDIGGVGILVNPSDWTTISYNIIDNTEDEGIRVEGGTNQHIHDNQVSHSGLDGINISNFGQAWIAYNNTSFTQGDGIEASNGDFISIYNNYIQLAGFTSGEPNEVVGIADGIHVNGITGASIPDLNTMISEIGFGFSTYGTAVEIYNNEVAIATDDGIDVNDSLNSYITQNTVGHVNDAGISVSEFDSTVVEENAVTTVGGRGINILNGIYAGIFDNRVLLTGEDGIHVEGISGGPASMELGSNPSYGEGWAVNISGNEVAMTGEDGIEVYNSGPTKISQNGIFMAGMGKALSETISQINSFASGTFVPEFASRTLLDLPSEEFSFIWGDGHGINVSNIYGSYYSPNGWATTITDNIIKYTGGHGILAQYSDRTLIDTNQVSYAGLEYNTFFGTTSLLELLNNGPFASDDRRDLWASEPSMIEVLESYIGTTEEDPETAYVTVGNLAYDAHDGIHAEGIGYYSESPYSEDQIFALEITNNNVHYTGDDGIHAENSGRTLIAQNTISDAGYGGGYEYGSGDYEGADGIFARNITAQLGLGDIYYPTEVAARFVEGYPYESDSNYALIIRNNRIQRTADDGIEVIGSLERDMRPSKLLVSDFETSEYEIAYAYGDRVLIAENTIQDTGYYDAPPVLSGKLLLVSEYSGNTGADGYGHDGIHVRHVAGTEYEYDYEYNPAGETNYGYYNYAVDVINNTVTQTGDDGIEVYNSASTLILGNEVSLAGVYLDEESEYGSNTDGADYYGADGIHVRNVGGNEAIFALAGYAYEPYSVVVTENTVNNVADDGIEVVGEGEEYYYDYEDEIIDSFDRVVPEWDSPSYLFNGTGRTLILTNTVQNAGMSGDSDSYDRYFYGNPSSYDGFGGDGIHVRGISPYYVYEGDYPAVKIIDNDVTQTGDDGIEVIGQSYGTTNVLVDINEVTNAGDNGIALITGDIYESEYEYARISLLSVFGGEMNSDVTGNFVQNSGNNGLLVGGYNHNEVLVSGNTFQNNPTGARFESGHIDFTDTENPNAFIVTPDYVLPEGFDYVTGMQFELAGFSLPASGLTIVDETLANTSFTGFLGRSVGEAFYVRFEDGAILNDLGEVIVIDGTEASWDGVIPVSFPGTLLPPEVLQNIEDRLYDADDATVNGRGQIFVGNPLLPFIAQEDLIQFFGPLSNQLGGLNVTILGLPNIPGAPQSFNNIAPAAGGGNPTDPAALNALTPAAGGGDGTPQALNDIDPAAGGQNASCFSNGALNTAGNGQTVNISYTGNALDLIEGETSCGS